MKYLIIDDNKYDVKLLTWKLQSIESDVDIEVSKTPIEGAHKVAEYDPDLVFLDYQLNNDNAFSYFDELEKQETDLPKTVILTGVDRGENIDNLLVRGAVDYFIKDDLKEDNLKILITKAITNFEKIEKFKSFKDVVDQSPEIKLILNLEGEVLYANKSASKAWKDEEIIGKRVEKLLVEQAGSYYKIPDDQNYYKILPVRTWHSDVSTITLINVTDEVHENQELEQKALKAENFSRMLIHDLKDNLSAINSMSDLMSQRLDASHKNDFALIQKAAKYSVGVIDSLAVISGLKKAAFDNKVNLGEIVEDLRESLSDKMCLQVDCPDDVVGNKNLLSSVMYNLISNSLKHSEREDGLKVVVTTMRKGTKVIVDFRDNGYGIPDELLEELFSDKVKGAKSLGMGLGLFIVKAALDIMNSEIVAVRSEVGAHLKITLPAFDAL